MARPRLGEEERRTRTVGVRVTEAEAGPELKHLAGRAATGRKLEKPVCHYSLSWAKDERPDRQEMKRAAAESLKALGLERHQTLIVSHRDGQSHVHVIANRVDPESGKAAGLSRSKLRLSKWAEDYEREQLVKDCRRVLGRFCAELEGRHRWKRVSLGKAHSEAVRGSERKVGEAYRSGMEGSEERAREAARTDGGSVYYIPPIERDVRLTVRAERMELVRELDGEQAYEKAHEKMRQAVKKGQPTVPLACSVAQWAGA